MFKSLERSLNLTAILDRSEFRDCLGYEDSIFVNSIKRALLILLRNLTKNKLFNNFFQCTFKLNS